MVCVYLIIFWARMRLYPQRDVWTVSMLLNVKKKYSHFFLCFNCKLAHISYQSMCKCTCLCVPSLDFGGLLCCLDVSYGIHISSLLFAYIYMYVYAMCFTHTHSLICFQTTSLPLSISTYLPFIHSRTISLSHTLTISSSPSLFRFYSISVHYHENCTFRQGMKTCVHTYRHTYRYRLHCMSVAFSGWQYKCIFSLWVLFCVYISFIYICW